MFLKNLYITVTLKNEKSQNCVGNCIELACDAPMITSKLVNVNFKENCLFLSNKLIKYDTQNWYSTYSACNAAQNRKKKQ